jgi:hypothetical protein
MECRRASDSGSEVFLFRKDGTVSIGRDEPRPNVGDVVVCAVFARTVLAVVTVHQ